MITLLIPTLNRSEFVIRYLNYLEYTDFQGCICIGDSSEPWHLERTKQAIKTRNSKFKVIHCEYPGLKIAECMRKMLPRISTPYAQYMCDDDLLVPKTMNQCMQFLEHHPEYSAVSGIILHCHLPPSNDQEKVVRLSQGRLNSVDADTATQRLTHLFNDYSVVAYSIARTEQMIRRWPLDPQFSDTRFSAELFPCSMQVVQGKMKILDRVLCVRQIHEQRYILPSYLDWIASPEWSTCYHIFKEELANELARQDSLSLIEARDEVRNAFGLYIELCNRKLRQPAGFSQRKSNLKQRLKKIPGINELWTRIYPFVNQNPFSLQTLLKTSSPYHNDFMQAYQIIVNSYQEKNYSTKYNQ